MSGDNLTLLLTYVQEPWRSQLAPLLGMLPPDERARTSDLVPLALAAVRDNDYPRFQAAFDQAGFGDYAMQIWVMIASQPSEVAR